MIFFVKNYWTNGDISVNTPAKGINTVKESKKDTLITTWRGLAVLVDSKLVYSCYQQMDFLFILLPTLLVRMTAVEDHTVVWTWFSVSLFLIFVCFQIYFKTEV